MSASTCFHRVSVISLGLAGLVSGAVSGATLRSSCVASQLLLCFYSLRLLTTNISFMCPEIRLQMLAQHVAVVFVQCVCVSVCERQFRLTDFTLLKELQLYPLFPFRPSSFAAVSVHSSARTICYSPIFLKLGVKFCST